MKLLVGRLLISFKVKVISYFKKRLFDGQSGFVVYAAVGHFFALFDCWRESLD